MNVIIAGGGIAGLEALMALRDLAPDDAEVTLLAPEPDFVYKPLLIEEPFTSTPAEQHALTPLVEELGGRFLQRALSVVNADEHRVELDDGSTLEYDALMVCVGANAEPAFENALTFKTSGPRLSPDEILGADVNAKRVAFVLPAGLSWPLPLYELALMSRRQAVDAGRDISMVVVTPEQKPLIMFGSAASAGVAELLEGRGIEVITGSRAEETKDGGFELMPGNRALEADRVVSLPALHGPRINGLPADERGFIPIDSHGRVKGVDDVYAAGDGTNFPIKHGGLGTEQADAAAEHIAARAGADVDPKPFHPVIRGQLIVGEESLNLQHDLTGGTGEGTISADYLWWPPHKVGGRYLSAWLAGVVPTGEMTPPSDPIDVEVVLPHEWHEQPMAIDPYGPIGVE